MRNLVLAAAGVAVALAAAPASADTLDDVIDRGVLRCGVVLDFPPIGFRDSNNEPAGFDVDYCADLAAALDVEHEIMPLTWAERLPVIVTGRADVVFGATSDTLERARTVGFTIPYAIYYAQGVVGVDSGIETFEDIRGKRVAAAVGTVPEQEWLEIAAEWGEEDLYQGYQSENEVFLAVAQGRADIGITTNTAVLPITQQYDTVIPGPRMPWTTDYTSVVAERTDVSWLNYLNLFVTHQVRSGRYQELWGQYVGGEAPELRIPGVMY
ncbi:MAG: transporter substrate-binding domain-containing protein [Rhizobiales bacterium]|nr:transporter substrate-binding domain-containing protein [Hyphomicrobiales bacterium]MBO6700611.1 transporter substrate-binding domain-containing protein [Hyphomicrobiales bacterium]MBO6738147.1 transporter substrate-binding domain-containing protein [Hyphomicrobiales bacterium]MBO6913546.1 transporter substrate-binding domain-containing protein [Hyphomicrobiales bacterium]MBO6955285.1 transporter substrate-binding domain-containing protein [Hyphomicrobiales bacterium]